MDKDGPILAILGFLRRMAFLACGLLTAWLAESQEVYIPDLTTVIDGGVEVEEGAVPDYEVFLPEPVAEETDGAVEVPQALPELPPSVVELATTRRKKTVFVEGLVAPAWPLSLLSRLRVRTEGTDPLSIGFSYHLVEGYGLEAAEEGFFHSRSFFGVEKTFTPGPVLLEVAGSFQSQDKGLQGRSLLFDDINRRGAVGRVGMRLPLGYGFALAADLPLRWYSRYAGFSSTVGRTELNEQVALSILALDPGLRVGWDSVETPGMDGNHRFLVDLGLAWDYTASLDPERALSRSRGSFDLSASWRWASSLEVSGGLSLVYLPDGTGLDRIKFLVPFSVGVRYSPSLSMEEEAWSVFASGGLSSRSLDLLRLEEQEPFVDFSPRLLLQYGERSDWFAQAGLQVPVAGAVVLDFGSDIRKSAFGNNLLVGDYAGGINGWTGLFAAETVDRFQFSTRVGVRVKAQGLLVGVAWIGQWLYHPAWLSPHAIRATLGYEASDGRWGAGMEAEFGIHGRDAVPVLGAQVYFRPLDNLTLGLRLSDMAKLFTGRQRVLVGPYTREAGAVCAAVEFSF